MELKDYFRAFTDDELLKGAELYFSGDIEKIVFENHPPVADEKERVFRKFPMEGTVTISGTWKEERAVWKTHSSRAQLRLDRKRGMVCETNCSCNEYHEDYYGCPHVAALLTAYMVKEKGVDVFRGSRLEALLSSLTNSDDPFQPGVLQRTDSRLLSLLKGNETVALPAWPESGEKPELIRGEFSLEIINGRGLVGIKAGPLHGRTLIVKDIPSFLYAYQKNEAYSLGKKEYLLGRHCADDRTGKILDFMSGLLAASDKGLYRANLFTTGTGRNGRYMMLSGPELKNFIALCDGGSIFLNDSVELKVELERKGLRAVLRKKAFGATLRISPINCLFYSGSELCLYDNEGIFRVQTGSTEKRQELLSLLDWTDELYIRESEIMSVFRNLLPVFQEYGTLEMKGIDPESYEKEKPSFIFNLDYPEEGILSCVPFAEYRNQGFRCHLYDSVTEAGKRNAEKEAEVASLLPEIFHTLDKKTHTLYSELNEEELFNFMREDLPRLEELGKVMATDSIKRNRVRHLPNVSVGVSIDSGQLLLSLKSAGLSRMEMADILGSYRKKKKYHRLKSGQFFSFDEKEGDAWETLSELFRDYGKGDPESFKVPAFRALYLQEMLETRDNTDFDTTKEYRDLVSVMDPESSSSLEVPDELKDMLRPYQAEGFRWINMLKNCGFGGILADDMGLGKTLQILSFLLSEKQKGKKMDEFRTLVVCPASLVYNWQKEIKTYVPSLTSIVIAGSAAERKELIESSASFDIWITSYDLLKRDIAQYEKIHFANEIIDEAQFVKNQKTQAAQSVRLVDSSFRMALTGTPIENYLSELWSIMDYLMPGFLFPYSRFQNEYETPIVSRKDSDVLDRLRKMVHPFILRRKKKQVLKELPDKLNETVAVRMDIEQKRLYDASVEEIRLMLDNVNDSEFRKGKLEFLAKLTQLRQICCDPSLLYDNYKGESAKLEACLQLLDEAVSGGHKVLLFSQFTSMLDIIAERLKKEEIGYHRIDGSVSKEKRMEMVDSFAYDDVPLFLISLKAGGTGLNLTAADIVIHYDPWWNQAAQDQATDRTHRIGQTRAVTVYELIVQDTIEERIQTIKEGKSKLVEDVLSGDAVSSTVMNKEELKELLS